MSNLAEYTKLQCALVNAVGTRAAAELEYECLMRAEADTERMAQIRHKAMRRIADAGLRGIGVNSIRELLAKTGLLLADWQIEDKEKNNDRNNDNFSPEASNDGHIRARLPGGRSICDE